MRLPRRETQKTNIPVVAGVRGRRVKNSLTRPLEQADWTPLIVTPPYPDYSSGHATVSGASQRVLTTYFGNDMPVEGWSEAFGETYVRRWPNFSAAADEANLARLWAGIHWRHAIVDGRQAGNAIGAYVMAHAAQPVHGQRRGQLGK